MTRVARVAGLLALAGLLAAAPDRRRARLGTLLASSFLDRRRSGSGLTGYSLDGTRKFHRFGNDPIWGADAIGRNALVGGPRGIALIDARTGRPLRRYRRFTLSLLSGDAPVLY